MVLLQWTIIYFVVFSTLHAFQLNSDTNDNINTQVDISFIRQLADRVKGLEAHDRKQERRINDLTTELADYKEYMQVLTDELSEKTDITATSLKNIKDASEIETNQQNDVKIEASRSRRAVSADVAFSAGLSHNILNAPAYHNIIFDHVETNIGNGYNSRDGIFTVPVSGTYVFYTSILSYHGKELYCRFVVNGVNKANTFARGSDSRPGQGSQLIVIQLHQGDQVAVQNKEDGDALFGNADIWTTFSGFLLHSN